MILLGMDGHSSLGELWAGPAQGSFGDNIISVPRTPDEWVTLAMVRMGLASWSLIREGI